MNQNISLFGMVLKKFKFVEPVPPGIQKQIRDIKRGEFIATLKKTGKYSLIFGLISYIFFTGRKMGAGISIIQSAIILIISTAIITVAISTGIYFTVIYASVPEIKIERIIEKEKPVISEKKSEKEKIIEEQSVKEEQSKEESAEVIKNRVGVQPFLVENIPKNISGRVSDRIAKELIRIVGGERVINMRMGRKKVGRMIMGSVELLEGSYTITAKIVNVSDSRILFYTSETIESQEEIGRACITISKRIAGEIK